MFQSTLNGNTLDSQVSYDPFTIPNAAQAVSTAQYNPYLEENANMVSGTAASYYSGQASYAAAAQPVSLPIFYFAGSALTSISSNITFTLP